MARARRIRTVGAVVVNPRHKSRRHKARRKAYRRTRRNPGRKHRAKARRKSRKARRNPRRGRVHVKAHSRRKARKGKRRARRNPYVLGSRRNPRRKGKRRHGRRHARRNPGYGRRMRASAITNPRHRRRRHARRNPGMSGISSSIGRIPFVGPLLASMIGLAPAAVVGAVSLEPTFQLAKWSVGQSWVPQYLKDSELAFFSLSGLLLGAGFAWLAPKTRFISAQTAKELAVGIAGAGAGAGYILYRLKSSLAAAGVTTPWQEWLPQAPATAGLGALLTAQGQPLGALNVAGYGMAPGYSVGPQGSFGPGGYGAVTLGAGVM